MNMTPSKKIIIPEIKKLISRISDKFSCTNERKLSRTEVYADISNTVSSLNKIGLHLQLNNFGQWRIYLSLTFDRTDTIYGGMAFCELDVCDSYNLLMKWLSSKGIVSKLYNEVCELSDSYIKNMWTDSDEFILSDPDSNDEAVYEVWYKDLVFEDPLYFVARDQSLTEELYYLMSTDKTSVTYSRGYKYGVYFTYVLYPNDVLKRKEYILRHDETLRNSIHNLKEPILQDMQNVCYELCAKAYPEFNSAKDINYWEDSRYNAGIRVKKMIIQPYDDEKESYMGYYCWIRLQVPDGLYYYEECDCKTPDEVKEWLSIYSQKQWILEKFTVEIYESCLKDEYWGLPSVYE